MSASGKERKGAILLKKKIIMVVLLSLIASPLMAQGPEVTPLMHGISAL